MTTRSSGGVSPRNGRLTIEWWLVALLSTLLVAFLAADRVTARIDNVVYDGFLRLGERAPRSDILIVAIDNRSLQELGKWPWPRERQAALIDRIAQSRPRAVAYDVLFVEPATPEGDRQLAQAIAKTKLFLPLLMRAPGTNGAAADAITPVPPIGPAATAIGQVNLAFDDDGLVRRVVPFASDGQRTWPHLMELMRRAASGAAPAQPFTPDRPVQIGYAGPPGQFRTISAASILRGEVPPEFLHDHLILVGLTADGVGDAYPVPVAGTSGVMSGVEIQANMLDAMLTGTMIRPLGVIPSTLASIVPLGLLLLAFRRLPPRNTVLLLLALLVLIGATMTALLLGLRLWLPPVPALVGLAIVYPLWGWRRLAAVSSYMVDELDRLQVEPHWLVRSEPPAPTAAIDPVGRQASLLQQSIHRMEDMRQFVVDRLQQMPDSIFVTDLHGRIVLANREAARLCADAGIPADGTIAALLDRMHSLVPDDPKPALPSAQADGRLWQCGLGERQSFDLRIVPQHARDGEHIGWIVRVTDTTEARTAEQQREDVLRLLSHDMRSPQTSIITAIDAAGRGEIGDALARRIKSHAQRTLDLADGFVQLARAESLDYVMEDIDLGDVVVEAADGLWEQASARGVAIDTTGVGEGITVTGERSLLTRALTNLIDNAIKYGGDGASVVCRVERDDARAICSVEDRGDGVPPELIGRLFEQFERAPGAVARRVEGAGLGLAFVHTVAVRHGGTIRCDSVPGARTTFTMTLPLAKSAER